MFIGPPIQCFRYEFPADIHTIRLRRVSLGHDPVENFDDLLSFDTLVHPDRQTLAREVIHRRQQTKPSPIKQRSETKFTGQLSLARPGYTRLSGSAALTCRRRGAVINLTSQLMFYIREY